MIHLRGRVVAWCGAFALALGVCSAQAAGRPDLTGVWENISGIHIDRMSVAEGADEIAKRAFKPADPPYTPEYAERYRIVRESAARGQPLNDPTATCLWPGVPRVIWAPYPIEIVVSDNGRRITFLHEYMSQIRRVYMDAQHPEDVEASFNGHTVGHWEGDVLVLDTVGLRGDTMLQNTGMMHSDQLRVRERWRLIGEDRLEAVISMEDPVAFTKPYVTTRQFRRHRDWEIVDYVCEENNRERIVNGVTTNKR